MQNPMTDNMDFPTRRFMIIIEIKSTQNLWVNQVRLCPNIDVGRSCGKNTWTNANTPHTSRGVEVLVCETRRGEGRGPSRASHAPLVCHGTC